MGGDSGEETRGERGPGRGLSGRDRGIRKERGAGQKSKHLAFFSLRRSLSLSQTGGQVTHKHFLTNSRLHTV